MLRVLRVCVLLHVCNMWHVLHVLHVCNMLHARNMVNMGVLGDLGREVPDLAGSLTTIRRGPPRGTGADPPPCVVPHRFQPLCPILDHHLRGGS